MGNSLGSKHRRAKVMKLDGETFKLKTPVRAGDVLKDHPPGHCLLESESVKHFGSRAKPLEPDQNLLPKRLYFLVELPKTGPATSVGRAANPRRVWSGPMNLTARDRLENLKLARRSASDLSALMTPAAVAGSVTVADGGAGEEAGTVRVKVRLPRAEVERLMRESKDGDEAAARIMDLCAGGGRSGEVGGGRGEGSSSGGGGGSSARRRDGVMKKRVSFLPINEAEMQIAVASY
ncbi:unnamed protein product [Linum trigynum]|uniref:Plastid movement impaired 2 n=1 Tax=Linum trigynum TaxID=586398 RepID=A0AAV2EXV8_9ROSI